MSHGFDWSAFLATVCAACGNLYCRKSTPLLEQADRAINVTRRGLGTTTPECSIGYLTALLVRSKHNAMVHGTKESLYARRSEFQGQPSLQLRFLSIPEIRSPVISHQLLDRFPEIADLRPFPILLSSLNTLVMSHTLESHFELVASALLELNAAGLMAFLVAGDATVAPLGLPVGVGPSDRASIFVPWDSRAEAEEVLERRFVGLWHLTKRNGLVQLAPIPYVAAPRHVSPRVFCDNCVQVSVVFYVKDSEYLVPLHTWRPCRFKLHDVFPLTILTFPHLASLPAARTTVYTGESQAPVQMLLGDDLGAAVSLSGNGPGPCRLLLVWNPALRSLQVRASGSEGPWLPDVRTEFDIGAEIHVGMNASELKDVRKRSKSPGLAVLGDKVKLKTWCMQQGIRIPEIYYMSNEHPELPQNLLTRKRFVAKPTHLADSSWVYAMQDGINLLTMNATSPAEIQRALRTAFVTRSFTDWVTEVAVPGVMVEELVEASGGERRAPDELKCHTVWGELFFCQWTWVTHVNEAEPTSLGDDVSVNAGHLDFGIPEFENAGLVFRDGTCILCEQEPGANWTAVVAMVERIAAGSDYLRVDVFISDGMPIFNEVTTTFLNIIGFIPAISVELARRWLEGYEALYSR